MRFSKKEYPNRRFLHLTLWMYAFFLVGYWTWKITYTPVRPAHTEAYIQQFSRTAQSVSEQTGIPIAILLAVGGLESGWGSSELAQAGNNHFGIKARDPLLPTFCGPTLEFYQQKPQTINACFRAYESPKESFLDFGEVLRSDERYRQLFENSRFDYQSWAQGLQQCGYATDPNYASKIIRIVKSYRLDVIGI